MRVIGLFVLVLGIAMGGWVVSVLGWRRMIGTDGARPHPALPALVLAGPYRLVRHPRALAVVLTVLGGGMMQERFPIWLCGVATTAAVLAAAWRDRQLLARFGEAYRRYQRAVPFLVPRRTYSG